MSIKPTRLAAAPKAGDTVRCLGGTMLGEVQRIVQTGSVAYAVVQWPGSIGRHTITTLEIVPKSP